MKTTVLVVVGIVVLSLIGSAAFAVSPYTLTATPSGPNWVYQLTNNSSLYVVDLELNWDSTIGSAADLAGAAANYSPTTSFISAPSPWGEIGGVAGIAAPVPAPGIAPGGTLNGYTVKFIGSTKPAWFSVGTCPDAQGTVYYPPDATFLVNYPTVPEPASLAAMLCGLAGFGFKLRRTKA